MWNVIEFIFSFIDTTLIFYFIKTFLGCNEKGFVKVIILLIIQTGINRIIVSYLGFVNLYAFIVMFITSGITFNVILKNNRIKIYFYTLVGIILSIIIEISFINLIISLTKNSEAFLEKGQARFFFAIISKLTYYIIVNQVSYKLKNRNFITIKKTYPLFLILMFDIGLLFFVGWVYKNIDLTYKSEKIFLDFTYIGVIFFNILLFAIIKVILIYSKKEMEWKIREEEYKKQSFYIKNVVEINNKLKSQRHDFNNHLNCIYGLIMLGKNQEAKNYIKNLTESIEAINYVLKIGHPIVSSLINMKLNEMKKVKIKSFLDVKLPKDIGIEDIDISIILGNLLDNGIEACKKIDEKKRFIDINIYTKSNFVIIKIKNSKLQINCVNNNYKGQRYTTKKDKEEHGFGLSNVKYVVNKYNGIIKIEDYGNKFEVNIAIPVKET